MMLWLSCRDSSQLVAGEFVLLSPHLCLPATKLGHTNPRNSEDEVWSSLTEKGLLRLGGWVKAQCLKQISAYSTLTHLISNLSETAG